MCTVVAQFGKTVSVGTVRRFAEAAERFASSRPPGCFEKVAAVTSPSHAVKGISFTKVRQQEIDALEALLSDLARESGLDAFAVERHPSDE